MIQVKTNNIKNYMVRPNADHVGPNGKVTVKIQTQTSIGAVSLTYFNKLILNFIQQTLSLKEKDRFLVQLSKLDETPKQALTPHDVAQLWEKVDKTKLI